MYDVVLSERPSLRAKHGSLTFYLAGFQQIQHGNANTRPHVCETVLSGNVHTQGRCRISNSEEGWRRQQEVNTQPYTWGAFLALGMLISTEHPRILLRLRAFIIDRPFELDRLHYHTSFCAN